MGILNGAKSFFSLLAGDTLVEEFPADWELKTQSIEFSAAKLIPARPEERKPEKRADATASKAAAAGSIGERERRKVLDRGASELLILFQREGRLVDFLSQDLEGFGDAEVGAAVREIHRGCRKVLKEHFAIRPILEGAAEQDEVRVPEGFNPEEIRLIGNVKGKPPFKGTLQHHGWKASKIDLPRVAEDVDTSILASAEVEV